MQVVRKDRLTELQPLAQTPDVVGAESPHLRLADRVELARRHLAYRPPRAAPRSPRRDLVILFTDDSRLNHLITCHLIVDSCSKAGNQRGSTLESYK